MLTPLPSWSPSARPSLLIEIDVSETTMAPTRAGSTEVVIRSAQWTPRRDANVWDMMAIDPSIKLSPQDVIGLMRLTASEGCEVLARSDALGPMHPPAMGSQLLPCVGLVVRPHRMAPRAPPGTIPPAIALMVGIGVVATPTGLRLVVIRLTCHVIPPPPSPRLFFLRLHDRLCPSKCMAVSRRLAVAAGNAAGRSERGDPGLPMLMWMRNVDGANRGEENPSGDTCRILELAAATTASWLCDARSAGVSPWRPGLLESPIMNPCTRGSREIMRLRAAEFEGGLNPSCSRLGTLPTGVLAAPLLHVQFEGGRRRLGLVTELSTGHVIVWLRV